MAFNNHDLSEATNAQKRAAHAQSSCIRLVAGPGTGKSKAICKRVAYLTTQGVDLASIFVVSFTRAATLELKFKIQEYCQKKCISDVEKVNVSTLHSLALHSLKKSGVLDSQFAVVPSVLDDWELTKLFDAEFSKESGIDKIHSRKIREYHEAIWETGQANPETYTPTEPPVKDSEIKIFDQFHKARSRLYACVLPSEIIRLCVKRMETGTFNVAEFLGIEHLIVDEFQDLNPIDLEFIFLLSKLGVKVFACGDDDQSIYSFRHTSPKGLQDFPNKFKSTDNYTLSHCFRCTPEILNAASSVLNMFPMPNRIPKNYISMHEKSEPPISGTVHRQIFKSCHAEAKAIAESCKNLITSGLPAKEILILLINSKEQFKPLKLAMDKISISFEYQKNECFKNDLVGRFLLYILRIAINKDDYFALRGLMYFAKFSNPIKINSIMTKILCQSLNFSAAVKSEVTIENLTLPERKTLDSLKSWIAMLQGWNSETAWSIIKLQINQMIKNITILKNSSSWDNWSSELPDDATCKDVYEILDSNTPHTKMKLLDSICKKLDKTKSDITMTPDAVRIMTMHSSKGLDSKVVFIPGLEQRFIPGDQTTTTTHDLEAARLLYVAVTRAKIGCIISYANYRMVRGLNKHSQPSVFCKCLNGEFIDVDGGLKATDVEEICYQAQLFGT